MNKVDSHPKSFFKRQPRSAESDRHDKYTAERRFASKVKQTAGGVSLFNVFQLEFEKRLRSCAKQHVGRDFRSSPQSGGVITNNNCVVIPTRLS